MNTIRMQLLVSPCLLLAIATFTFAGIAHAQLRGGAMRAGSLAQSSISAANRASMAAIDRRARPAGQPAASIRPAQGAGARPSTGDINAGNRVNTGSINAGNRVNTGDINTGNRINTGDINVDRDVNIDVDHDGWGGWRDVDVDIDGGPGDWNIDVDIDHYHPVATAAAVAAATVTTAAIVGAYYYSVPAGCPIVYTYPRPYYYCGGVYYEQRMQGDKVVYVVVQP